MMLTHSTTLQPLNGTRPAKPPVPSEKATTDASLMDGYAGSVVTFPEMPKGGSKSGPRGIMPTPEKILSTDYRSRLKALLKLGKRFPGVTEVDKEKGGPLHSLGVWAGLFMQTSWQNRSGRSKSAFWSILNYSLTKHPEKFAAEYESGKRVPPSAKVKDGQLTENDVRQSWYKFFQSCDKSKTRPLRPGNLLKWLTADEDHPQKALWDAHCKSLHFFRQEYGDYLQTHADPAQENDLEQSWVHFVDYLAEANFPTTSKYAAPILKQTMPDGGILGKDLDLSELRGMKRIFATALVGLSGIITRLPSLPF